MFLPCALMFWAVIRAWDKRKTWRNERLFVVPATILSLSAIIAHVFISELAAVSSSVFLVMLIVVLILCVRASSIGMVWFIMMMARYDRYPDERREPPVDISGLPETRFSSILQALLLVGFLAIVYLVVLAQHG